ncbi:ATP-binding protein [Streptomyces sp. NPDC007901]|uniref:ATP-binding protein n=1 Tax=Streptomyces sp. NPDC007901 TaxID=3364785 RepID=UPI0036F151B4
MTHLELHLTATPKAAPELRHHLRDHTFEVRLCATELLTNVIEHVGEGTPVTVSVMGADDHGRARIEVTDPDPRTQPTLLPATETQESGRGLAVIDALADRWGVDQGPDRKTVWCELRENPGGDPADGGAVSGVAPAVHAMHGTRGGHDRRQRRPGDRDADGQRVGEVVMPDPVDSVGHGDPRQASGPDRQGFGGEQSETPVGGHGGTMKPRS